MVANGFSATLAVVLTLAIANPDYALGFATVGSQLSSTTTRGSTAFSLQGGAATLNNLQHGAGCLCSSCTGRSPVGHGAGCQCTICNRSGSFSLHHGPGCHCSTCSSSSRMQAVLTTHVMGCTCSSCAGFGGVYSTGGGASRSSRTTLHMSTKVVRNENFAKLKAGYLFPEIARRRNAYLAENPDVRPIISLGIGDTTQPIPSHILSGLVDTAKGLGTKDGYSGYGAEQGKPALREKISQELYKGLVKPDEVFVSDGAKCDIARLQLMFGSQVVSAVQDPSYPVYVDTSVMMGQTGNVNEETMQFDNIVYMPCKPDNDFFPDLDSLPRADVIYFCSPNNPTGAVASRDQLERLVAHAKKQGSIVIFDAAYAPFIRTPGVPKSIFEIEGARSCCIEVNSFSKYAGFTGVRLGWTVIPDEVKYADGTPVRNDFNRVMTTAFNGASNIVQGGGMACVDPDGLAEIDKLITYYLDNARILKEGIEACGFKAHGGKDSPYVYVDLGGKSSWDMFSEILEKAQVVTIPGAGFGPGGEGFIRLSAFAPKDSCIEAVQRLKDVFA